MRFTTKDIGKRVLVDRNGHGTVSDLIEVVPVEIGHGCVRLRFPNGNVLWYRMEEAERWERRGYLPRKVNGAPHDR